MGFHKWLPKLCLVWMFPAPNSEIPEAVHHFLSWIDLDRSQNLKYCFKHIFLKMILGQFLIILGGGGMGRALVNLY